MSTREPKHAILALIAVASLTAAAGPQRPIPGLFNTGVEAAGGALPKGTPEMHYAVSGPATSAIIIDPHPAWPDPPLGSAWIAPSPASVDDPVGEYVYRLEFDLSGLDPTTASLQGEVACDDPPLFVRLNGVEVFTFAGGSFDLQPFSVSSSFVQGLNVIEFQVDNCCTSSGSGGPTGLLISSLAGQASPVGVPVPALPAPHQLALLVLIAGLGILALKRRARMQLDHDRL